MTEPRITFVSVHLDGSTEEDVRLLDATGVELDHPVISIGRDFGPTIQIHVKTEQDAQNLIYAAVDARSVLQERKRREHLTNPDGEGGNDA